MTPVNVTSGLSKDERTLIEDELQKNQTSVIMEDDGEFVLILHEERKPSVLISPFTFPVLNYVLN